MIQYMKSIILCFLVLALTACGEESSSPQAKNTGIETINNTILTNDYSVLDFENVKSTSDAIGNSLNESFVSFSDYNNSYYLSNLHNNTEKYQNPNYFIMDENKEINNVMSDFNIINFQYSDDILYSLIMRAETNSNTFAIYEYKNKKIKTICPTYNENTLSIKQFIVVDQKIYFSSNDNNNLFVLDTSSFINQDGHFFVIEADLIDIQTFSNFQVYEDSIFYINEKGNILKKTTSKVEKLVDWRNVASFIIDESLVFMQDSTLYCLENDNFIKVSDNVISYNIKNNVIYYATNNKVMSYDILSKAENIIEEFNENYDYIKLCISNNLLFINNNEKIFFCSLNGEDKKIIESSNQEKTNYDYISVLFRFTAEIPNYLEYDPMGISMSKGLYILVSDSEQKILYTFYIEGNNTGETRVLSNINMETFKTVNDYSVDYMITKVSGKSELTGIINDNGGNIGSFHFSVDEKYEEEALENMFKIVDSIKFY